MLTHPPNHPLMGCKLYLERLKTGSRGRGCGNISPGNRFSSILGILVLATSLFAAETNPDPRTTFCQKQFDYFVSELNKLQTNYTILADLQKGEKIDKQLADESMWYSLLFYTNCSHPFEREKDKIFSTPPYCSVEFSIGWRTPEQMRRMAWDPRSLEHAFQHKTLNVQDKGLSHWTPSHLLISARVWTDNKALKKEVGAILEKIVDEIMKWEEERKKRAN